MDVQPLLAQLHVVRHVDHQAGAQAADGGLHSCLTISPSTMRLAQAYRAAVPMAVRYSSASSPANP